MNLHPKISILFEGDENNRSDGEKENRQGIQNNFHPKFSQPSSSSNMSTVGIVCTFEVKILDENFMPVAVFFTDLDRLSSKACGNKVAKRLNRRIRAESSNCSSCWRFWETIPCIPFGWTTCS